MLFTSGLLYFLTSFSLTHLTQFFVFFYQDPCPHLQAENKKHKKSQRKQGAEKNRKKKNISNISETLSVMSDSPLQSDLETVVFLNMADEFTAQVEKQTFLPAEYGEVTVSIKWMGFGAMCKSLIQWYLYTNSKFDLVSNEAEKDAQS